MSKLKLYKIKSEMALRKIGNKFGVDVKMTDEEILVKQLVLTIYIYFLYRHHFPARLTTPIKDLLGYCIGLDEAGLVDVLVKDGLGHTSFQFFIVILSVIGVVFRLVEILASSYDNKVFVLTKIPSVRHKAQL